jgi:hypothetical protein
MAMLKFQQNVDCPHRNDVRRSEEGGIQRHVSRSGVRGTNTPCGKTCATKSGRLFARQK